MSTATHDRLVGLSTAFEDPVALWLGGSVAVVTVVAYVGVVVARRAGALRGDFAAEIVARCRTWFLLSMAFLIPLMLGAAWTSLAILLVSLLCYREFARATGLFRERTISALVVLGILALTVAILNNWYASFVVTMLVFISLIPMIGAVQDRPTGYIQRVAMGSLAFLFFGACLGHFGYMTNSDSYRRLLLWLLIGVAMNDNFAYLVGKAIGKRKLAPHTSPGKTVGGAVGALILTTLLVAWLGHIVFEGRPVDRPLPLLGLGVLVSVLGQMGDLVMSSVKRDLGVKDLGTALPGHGGFLDRIDSLLFVAPAVYHYLNTFQSLDLAKETRILF